jgi:ubiquitin carboxyl-terminal hydrolase 8
VRRETGVYRSSGYSRNITDNVSWTCSHYNSDRAQFLFLINKQFNAPYPQSMAGLSPGYNGQPMIPNSMVSATSRSSQPSAYSKNAYTSASPTPPPLASTSPGPLSRKRSDYVDQHNQAYSGYQNHTSRPSMDYPQIGVSSIPQPPPAAATSSSERQESRPRADRSASIISFDGLSKLPESDDMMYWNDVALGISGLKNLGK